MAASLVAGQAGADAFDSLIFDGTLTLAPGAHVRDPSGTLTTSTESGTWRLLATAVGKHCPPGGDEPCRIDISGLLAPVAGYGPSCEWSHGTNGSGTVQYGVPNGAVNSVSGLSWIPAGDGTMLFLTGTSTAPPNQSGYSDIGPIMGGFRVVQSADCLSLQGGATSLRVVGSFSVLGGASAAALPPPDVPTLIAPAAGATVGVAPTFTVEAVDVNHDAYVAEVEITLPSGGKQTTLLGPAASGQQASGVPIIPFALAGSGYSWRARGCDAWPAQCGFWSSSRAFSVTTGTGNQPPGTPVQLSPVEGGSVPASGDQAFAVTSTDTDNDAFTATIRLKSSAGATLQTITTPSTSSGGIASANASPNLIAGSYLWDVKACQTGAPALCSGFSPDRTFTVAAAGANTPPGAPTQDAPAANATFQPGDPQFFQVLAADGQGDPYRGRILVALQGGGGTSFDLSPAPSGQPSAGVAQPPLPPGTHTWSAVACEVAAPGDCGPASGSRTVTVAGTAGGSSMTIVKPAAGHVYEYGERQDIAVRAVFVDGSPYRPTIGITRAMGDPWPDEIAMTPAASGTESYGFMDLPPGSYSLSALASAIGGGTVGATTSFGVAAPGLAPCTGPALVDGWFGDRYLRIGTATVGDVGYVCVRTVEGAAKVSGWLRAESGGTGAATPTVGASAACTDGGDDHLPFPLLDAGTGDPANQPNSLRASLRRANGTLTACFKVKAGGATVLDHSVTIQSASGADFSDLNFIPELDTLWAPPPPVAPAAGLPSSECAAAAGGVTRLVNAAVAGQRVWLYRQQDSAVARVCARVQGGVTNGVVVRVPASGGALPVITDTTARAPDDPGSPCGVTELWANAPAIVRLRRTDAAADPAGLCVYAGPNATTGVSAWLLIDRSPGGPTPTLENDV